MDFYHVWCGQLLPLSWMLDGGSSRWTGFQPCLLPATGAGEAAPLPRTDWYCGGLVMGTMNQKLI
jgi:hypothetical protein